MNRDDYIVIQGWMVTDLNLKGNDLMAYALIYGFSRETDTYFTGSLQYVADWLNIDKRSVNRTMKRLVDCGLFLKEDVYIKGVKFCRYKAIIPTECTQNENTILTEGCTQNVTSGDKMSPGVTVTSGDKLSTNNIDIYTNTYNNINNNNTNKLNTIFNNKEKKHKNTIAQDLEKVVNEYTTNEELRQALLEFIQMRKDLKSPIKTLNGFKRLLGTLNKLASKAEDKIKIVNQSLDHEWKSFYELKTNQLPHKNMNNGYLVGNYKPTEKTLKELHKRDNEEIEWSDEVF